MPTSSFGNQWQRRKTKWINDSRGKNGFLPFFHFFLSTAKQRESSEDFHNRFSNTHSKLLLQLHRFSFATDGSWGFTSIEFCPHGPLLWLIAEFLHALCMPRHLEKGSDSVPYALSSSQCIPSSAVALCLLLLCIQKSGLPFHAFYFLLAICLITFWKTVINCVSRCYWLPMKITVRFLK